MNERVIELANKANEDIGYTFNLEDAKQLHELMEKFAELLIRECAAMAWWTEQYGMGGGVPISKQIEHHFDVPNERSALAKLRERFGVTE